MRRMINSFFVTINPVVTVFEYQLFCLFFYTWLVVSHLNKMRYIIKKYQSAIDYNAILFFEDIGFVSKLSDLQFEGLYYLLIFFLILCAFNIGSRFTFLGSFLLFFVVHAHILGLDKVPGSNYVWHSENVNCIMLFLLFVDRNRPKNIFLFFSKEKIARSRSTEISGSFFFLVTLILGFAYFSVSSMRVMDSGLEWVNSESFQAYLIESYLHEGSQLALDISSIKHLPQLLSIITMVFEFGFIFLIWIKRFRPLLFIAGFIFHIGIFYIMNIDFISYHLSSYLVFLFLPPLNNIWRDKELTSNARREFSSLYGFLIVSIIAFFTMVFKWEYWPVSNFAVFSKAQKLKNIAYYTVEVRDENGTTFPLQGTSTGLKMNDLFIDLEMPEESKRSALMLKRCLKAEEYYNHLYGKDKWSFAKLTYEHEAKVIKEPYCN